MKARRLGDPERLDEDEEDFFFRRRGALGIAFAGGLTRDRAPLGGSRAERFPGVDVSPATRDDRDVWYQDPIRSNKQ